MLEFRTGSGLRFTVLVDRAMDIAECEHNGRAIGWHSPTGRLTQFAGLTLRAGTRVMEMVTLPAVK